MQVEVGKIYEGKVTGITKFGAFVEVEGNVTGMVHISEVSNTFVQDINEVLKKGQAVKVKVIKIDDSGKIGMSIKRTEERPRNDKRGGFVKDKDAAAPKSFAPKKPPVKAKKEPEPVYYSDGYVAKPSGDVSFEDMLSKFKASSEERMSDLKRTTDNKRRGGSRRR